MSRRLGSLIVCVGAFLPWVLSAAALAATPDVAVVEANRVWEVLPAAGEDDASRRVALKRAARLLDAWQLEIAGVAVDGSVLSAIVKAHEREPLTRVTRELLGRPVDVIDLLHFLDDVLVAGKRGLRGARVVLPQGRARAVGVLLHPDDVFRERPRIYGLEPGPLAIDAPLPPAARPPAADGEVLGPNWASRYPNPMGEDAMLAALTRLNPGSTFSRRVRSFMEQLRAQGAEVHLATTVRNQQRGILMWGAYNLSRAETERALRKRVDRLGRLGEELGLQIPIQWQHPDGWRATVESARQMADAFEVVHASENGARRSKHYDGWAADVTAVALPRRLTLEAADGVHRTFDLSGAEQSRDVNLTPELVSWVERHFRFKKLKGDYPHWEDAERVDLVAATEDAESTDADELPSGRASPVPALP